MSLLNVVLTLTFVIDIPRHTSQPCEKFKDYFDVLKSKTALITKYD
jgi:hypothetical protein